MSFDWQCQPKAEKWLNERIAEYKEKNKFIEAFEKELLEKASSRLFDWLDHLTVDASLSTEYQLLEAGFEQESAMGSYRVFSHPGAKLPSVLLKDSDSKHKAGLTIKVDSIADFLMVRGLEKCIEGSPYSPYRRCLIHQEEVAFFAVERRGSHTMEPSYMPESYLEHYITALEYWQSRPRPLDDEEEALKKAITIAEEMVGLLGKDVAACIVFEIERKYWQSKNKAAQAQKNRQDELGLGWANHDHHTFRSSRKLFVLLVRLFETLGFHCREQYHAGKDAGWGAQIMENPTSGLIAFLDVDLAPEELTIDFAHHPLPEKKELATVGLWCALHGDSIVRAGMHHLEAQFDFDRLKEDLAKQGIGMMDPFSNFTYLRQAFTKAEMWSVDPKRIHKLLEEGKITYEQADLFLKKGAVGSHLENLQRNEGYKGFNKDNVSVIMKKTDPRLQGSLA